MTEKPHDPKTEGLEHPPSGPFRHDFPAEPAAVTSFDVIVPRAEKTRRRTAFDDKEAHRQLVGWADEDLKQVPLLTAGSPLEQGATYVDLRDPARREFKATGEMRVPENGLYVPRSEVHDQLWYRLLGVRMPERIG